MFRLLGFDVRVRTGFVLFLGLIVMLNPNEFGVWLAIGIAGFTLVHELGHATAARRAGAQADISLDFMAGYTSFQPAAGRTIGRADRALITAAGPTVHIVTSLAVLLAMGVNPLSFDSIRDGGDAAAALWWAGPMIGALNLIPVLPLDGGHLALTGVEGLLGDRALRAMAIFSIALTGAGAVAMFALGHSGFAVFVAFLVVSQLQLLGATSTKAPRTRANLLDQMVAAEHEAWATGRPGMLAPGQQLSPWFVAHRALTIGDEAGARRAILADLESPDPNVWAPPGPALADRLRPIIDVLPDDLPHGNAYSGRVLTDVLLATGNFARAGKYAVESYHLQRTSGSATIVARAAAAMGDTDTALLWIESALDDTRHEAEMYSRLLAVALDKVPEFTTLRAHPRFAELRDALPRAVAAPRPGQ